MTPTLQTGPSPRKSFPKYFCPVLRVSAGAKDAATEKTRERKDAGTKDAGTTTQPGPNARTGTHKDTPEGETRGVTQAF